MIGKYQIYRVQRRLDLASAFILLMAAAAFGGSSIQSVEGHLYLQAIAVPVLAWAFLSSRPVPWSGAAMGFLAICLVFAGFALLQLLPFPGVVWPEGSPHDVVSRAYELLGVEVPALQLSLTPGETVSSILAFLPPLAMFALMATARWTITVQPVCWALVVLGAISSSLGIAQLLTGADSGLYLYDPPGVVPTGLFSNPNHQASFLLMLLPVSLALLLERRQHTGTGDGEMGLLLGAAGLFLLLIAGVLTAGSGAGYAMLVGVVPLCALVAWPSKRGKQTAIALPATLGAVVLGVLATLAVTFVPQFEWADSASMTDRPSVWQTSTVIAHDHMPFGSGFGSFEHVYPLYEDAETVSDRYVNATHNEYLQIVVEMGALGALVLAAVLVLWVICVLQTWRSKLDNEGRLRRAASISTLVVLLHSLIDYPLRAPLFAVVAAACLAILVIPARHIRQKQRQPVQMDDKRITL